MVLCQSVGTAVPMTQPFEPYKYEKAKNSTSYQVISPGQDVGTKEATSLTSNGKDVLCGKWVLEIKRAANGSIQK